jgi:AMMECR1 domain-containing protein
VNTEPERDDADELEHLCAECGLPCDCAEVECQVCFFCVTVTQREDDEDDPEAL